jgi:ubiquinone/menaquinone biosynthesis C-methylase UbiE
VGRGGVRVRRGGRLFLLAELAMIGRQEERADFDRLAPHYGWMERLLAGRKLQRCRAAFLQAIPPPRRALVAGQGHGAFVAELLRAHPQVRCTCVDSSSGMLQAARARLRQDGLDEARAEFIQADLLDWAAPERNSI